MSEMDRQRIFEPFYTKKAMGRSGTGLGMAVVWGTVKDHHGYLEVLSEPGIGSTFTLYFLSTPEQIVQEDDQVPIDEYKGNGEKILVVDDVEEQREIATKILERLGYHVETVSSGEEALEFLKYKGVDLLVLDMIMSPGIDGLETYKRVLAMNPILEGCDCKRILRYRQGEGGHARWGTFVYQETLSLPEDRRGSKRGTCP